MTSLGSTRSPRNDYWARGEIVELSRQADISYNMLISILHRIRRPSFQAAEKLEKGTKILGRKIEKRVWLDCQTTDHPAFRTKGTVNIDTAQPAGKFSRNPYWAQGEISELCKAAHVSRDTLTKILHRRIATSYPIALRLEAATKCFDHPIDRHDWLDNLGSKHPAFSGEPVKTSRRPEHCFVNIDKKEDTNA
jgi:transcriptional regulator with XRE-family HTH domain